VPVASVGKYQNELATFMETKKPGILQTIAEKKTLDDALKAEINTTLTEFGKTFAGASTAA
jgi:F0F1-type ATP synthase alpha subunit